MTRGCRIGYDFRVSAFISTRTPGIYVRHQVGCPAPERRCRCQPSYRAQRYGIGWSPTFRDKKAAEEWKASVERAAENEAQSTEGITFGTLAREWWAGVESGSVGKRKGRKGDGYSETTLAGYKRSLHNTLLPEFGNDPAESLDEQRWQAWVDKQARKGLSRSRIANHIAVVSAIYGWGARATRRLVPRNPTLAVELPPNDEKARERVATVEEASALLAALSAADRVPYGLAFYAGLRRSEIARLEWRDVDLGGLSLVVRRSKSDAGTGRRIPIAEPLAPILESIAWQHGVNIDIGSISLVSPVSVMSGKLAERARKAWAAAKLQPIGLHECRHTYASLLVASKYTLKEVMDFMGHADLQTTSRYVKRLPQPNEANPAERLNAYLNGGE